jgi:hypothetical protein
MVCTPDPIITKSDFLLYCVAPRHLWAKLNGRITQPPSEMDRLIGEQGYQVEALAHDYLELLVATEYPEDRLSWQATFTDGAFEARVDALLYKPDEDAFNLYEIKSATCVDKTDLLDVTFQAAILKHHMRVTHYYLLHLNKEYVRNGELDLIGLFIREDVSDKIEELLPAVEQKRLEAWASAREIDPGGLTQCLTPRQCPCPEVCFPFLPEFSIFDIPLLNPKKKRQLLEAGISEARDIPDGFDLNDKQKLVVDLAKTNGIHINKEALRSELEKVSFPVYFLDYETCISAIPQYPGYRPQQQIVFQYSLHIMTAPDIVVTHAEHLSLTRDDPSLPLLARLRQDIGDEGSVIVWNKVFEMTRNDEMAALHPVYSPFLERLNQRIYDLGDPVKFGFYLHPGFKGSWSIKKVLPVLRPEMSYSDLEVNQGDQASITWWNLCFGSLQEDERKKNTEALLRYCEMDSLAMVEIYRAFRALI